MFMPMHHGTTYVSDEAFFLHSLSRRYPSIVPRATVDRWTAPTFRGSYVTDPAIVSANPARSSGSESGGRSGGRSFGGGSSWGGGGGGGSW